MGRLGGRVHSGLLFASTYKSPFLFYKLKTQKNVFNIALAVGSLYLAEMAVVHGVRAELLECIKVQGEATIDGLAERLGHSKTNIRQHLITLERQSLIVRDYRRAGRGRPQVVYRLSESGAGIFPSQDPKLLRSLLQFLLKNGQEDLVEQFFQDFWSQRWKTFESRLAQERDDHLKTRLKVLKELLEEEGFMPEVEYTSPDKFTIRECNCPFSEAVKATTLPCKLEARFLRKATGAGPTRVSYIPNGEAACSYRVASTSSGRIAASLRK